MKNKNKNTKQPLVLALSFKQSIIKKQDIKMEAPLTKAVP